MSVLDNQIADQIAGATRIVVWFPDARPEYFTLYDQPDSTLQDTSSTWIKPPFCTPRRIPRELMPIIRRDGAHVIARQIASTAGCALPESRLVTGHGPRYSTHSALTWTRWTARMSPSELRRSHDR